MWRLQGGIAALSLAVMACTASISGTPLRIETRGFQFSLGTSCGGFGIPGIRIVRDGDALRFFDVGTGQETALSWPFGFVAKVQDGQAALYASDGTLVGREGDVLTELGSCGSVDGVTRVDSVGTREYR